jgi:lipopolysaccharide/colanic/teichoic acid biosynthesis glycosyltransferase
MSFYFETKNNQGTRLLKRMILLYFIFQLKFIKNIFYMLVISGIIFSSYVPKLQKFWKIGKMYSNVQIIEKKFQTKINLVIFPQFS